jgi:transposase
MSLKNFASRCYWCLARGHIIWLFCWTELGAHQIGVMQSLLVTCKLHDIDPYDYLVDVLQRISEHPNSKIEELTPRRWKELFASNPMRSALHQTVANGNNAVG